MIFPFAPSVVATHLITKNQREEENTMPTKSKKPMMKTAKKMTAKKAPVKKAVKKVVKKGKK